MTNTLTSSYEHEFYCSVQSLLDSGDYDSAFSVLNSSKDETAIQLLKIFGKHFAYKKDFSRALFFYKEVTRYLDTSYSEYHSAMLSMGIIYSRVGMYDISWEFMSHRYKILDHQLYGVIKNFNKPIPKELPKDGKILIWGDEGIGDEVRYFQLLHHKNFKGLDLIGVCNGRLMSILRRTFPNIYWVDMYNILDHDYHIPSVMLGKYVFNDNTFERTCNKTLLDNELITINISKTLNSVVKNGGKNIGVSWKTFNESGAARTISPEVFCKVFNNNNNYISLQHGDVNEDINFLSQFDNFYVIKNMDVTKELDDLLSCICNLDEVITIDNTVAHLSLSMNIKTKVLLPYNHHFLWGEEKCVWWPKALLFKQSIDGDWDSVIKEVCDDYE